MNSGYIISNALLPGSSFAASVHYSEYLDPVVVNTVVSDIRELP